jgi:hypothetical protein
MRTTGLIAFASLLAVQAVKTESDGPEDGYGAAADWAP